MGHLYSIFVLLDHQETRFKLDQFHESFDFFDNSTEQLAGKEKAGSSNVEAVRFFESDRSYKVISYIESSLFTFEAKICNQGRELD